MASAGDDLAMPPGYSFCPADKELTDIYLRRKISASDEFAGIFESRFFHDADVYSAEPEKLVQPFSPAPGTGTSDKSPPVWYFFSPVRYASKKKNSGRRSRTIGGDGGKKWHTEESQKSLKEGGSAFGGYVQRFSYVVKNMASKASSGKKEEDEKKRPGWIMMEYGISPEHGGDSLVLCKVYPRNAKTAAVAPVSDSPGINNLRKRKAAAGDHPEAPATSVRPRIESETCYGDQLDAVANEDVNMCPITTWVTSEQEAAVGTTAAHLPMFFDQGTTEYCFGIADPVPEPETVAADYGLVANHQPFSFWQEMEQEFEASYPISNSLMVDGSGGDLATPPCAPAADQPEEDAAGLVQNISGEEDQNNGGDGAARTQLYEQAADEVIYGFSCQDPGFSLEMLERFLSE